MSQEISLEEIYEQLKKELSSVDLQPLKEEFYELVRNKIKKLNEEIEKTEEVLEKKMFEEIKGICHDLVLALLITRLKKGLNEEWSSLVKEEKEILQSIEERIFKGRIEKEKFKGEDKVTVKILEETASFIGPVDLKIYGPFKGGDLVYTKYGNIKPLVSKRKAEIVNI